VHVLFSGLGSVVVYEYPTEIIRLVLQFLVNTQVALPSGYLNKTQSVLNEVMNGIGDCRNIFTLAIMAMPIIGIA
jgi:hypothetical protein